MDNIILYTDGACSGNPGPGGWGAVLIFNSIEKELSGANPNTTNNVMEITAVIEGLKALKRPCNVDIYSDSAYVVNCFEKIGLIIGLKIIGSILKKNLLKIKNFGLNCMI